MKYTIDQLRQVKGIGNKAIERIVEQFDESTYISKYDSSIHIDPNSLVHGDMLEVMNGIPDKSVDMILTDLPYGTTKNKWDSPIDLDKMWKQYNRVIKDNGAIVLFAQAPFDSVLSSSNKDMYKYKLYWEKETGTGHLNANYQPMKIIEELLVFTKSPTSYTKTGKPSLYNPQMRTGFSEYSIKKGGLSSNYDKDYTDEDIITTSNGDRFPISLIKFQRDKEKLHPTQKPLKLIEYLIKTYSNQGGVVLDSTMGSGTTCLGAKNLDRQYIGVELDKDYYDIALKRVCEESYLDNEEQQKLF